MSLGLKDPVLWSSNLQEYICIYTYNIKVKAYIKYIYIMHYQEYCRSYTIENNWIFNINFKYWVRGFPEAVFKLGRLMRCLSNLIMQVILLIRWSSKAIHYIHVNIRIYMLKSYMDKALVYISSVVSFSCRQKKTFPCSSFHKRVFYVQNIHSQNVEI